MTQPIFQELLTCQKARDKVACFRPVRGKGTHWLTTDGSIISYQNYHSGLNIAIWQGYLQEAAPPPEPRVFKRVEYRNIYKVEGIGNATFATRHDAALCGDMNGGCVGRVRVEITATEGQYDD
jgi:hypothetical protein